MPADEFFVGYLPTPSGTRRFLRIAVAIVAVFVCVIGVVVARLQRDPGDARWGLNEPIELSGVIRTSPYPTLESEGSSLLLVSEGKFAATDRLQDLDGEHVRVKGTLLKRKSLSMLELSSDPAGITKSANLGVSPTPPAASKLRTVTLQGEIVDTKCFLGAMKPGDGKAHKACASLCIRGGIPPMLVMFDASGHRTDLLLIDSSGGPIRGDALESVLPFVADRVEVTGVWEERGDLNYLRIGSVGAIRRL